MISGHELYRVPLTQDTSVASLKSLYALEQVKASVRHSRGSGNPVVFQYVTSTEAWTPAFAGVTELFA